jgi:hypothetical protein
MWRGNQSGQARKLQKKKNEKVANYKLFAQYKRALKSEGEAAVGNYAAEEQSSYNTVSTSSHNPSEDAPERPTWQRGAGPEHVDGEQQGNRKRPKKKKLSAAAAARRQWEKEQADIIAEREAAEAARAQREAEKAAARKRRSDQLAIHKKRTKRGQPTLGLQMDLLLQKLQR